MNRFENAFRLDGRVAVITGGATGLGLAMSQCIVSAGGRVIMIGRRKDLLESACNEIGDNASSICYDITATDGLNPLVAEIVEKYGKIDILINNAGNQYKKPVEEMSVTEFTDVLDVHLVASFALTKAVLPYMRQKKHGSVLFIASMCSYIGNPNLTGYAAAKSGVLGLMRTFASEASQDNVRFNAIAPGWIETPMFQRALGADPNRKAKILDRTPMKTFGQPEDIGWAAVYLSSDASKFITGTEIIVDGGAVIGF